MRYFDFSEETARAVARAETYEDRLSARTSVGKEQFGRSVAKAGLRLLATGDRLDLDAHPDSLVIGVATWSDPEMILLDSALEYLRQRHDVFVFDIDMVQSLELLITLMPQTSLFRKTPVIAEYMNGFLLYREEGKHAEAFLISRCA